MLQPPETHSPPLGAGCFPLSGAAVLVSIGYICSFGTLENSAHTQIAPCQDFDQGDDLHLDGQPKCLSLTVLFCYSLGVK